MAASEFTVHPQVAQAHVIIGKKARGAAAKQARPNELIIGKLLKTA
jgi:hypothetical protein